MIQHPQGGREPRADTKLEIVILLKEGGKRQREAAQGRVKQTKMITRLCSWLYPQWKLWDQQEAVTTSHKEIWVSWVGSVLS